MKKQGIVLLAVLMLLLVGRPMNVHAEEKYTITFNANGGEFYSTDGNHESFGETVSIEVESSPSPFENSFGSCFQVEFDDGSIQVQQIDMYSIEYSEGKYIELEREGYVLTGFRIEETGEILPKEYNEDTKPRLLGERKVGRKRDDGGVLIGGTFSIYRQPNVNMTITAIWEEAVKLTYYWADGSTTIQYVGENWILKTYHHGDMFLRTLALPSVELHDSGEFYWRDMESGKEYQVGRRGFLQITKDTDFEEVIHPQVAPTTEAPTTEAPTTEAPTTEALTTEAPTTEASTTEAPTTEAATTEAPTTEVPTFVAQGDEVVLEEKTLKEAAGVEDASVVVIMEVEKKEGATSNEAVEQIAEVIRTAPSDMEIIGVYEVTVKSVMLDSDGKEIEGSQKEINQLNKPVRLSFKTPGKSGKTYLVVRVHTFADGKIEVSPLETYHNGDGMVSVESNLFSLYYLVEKNESSSSAPTTAEPITVAQASGVSTTEFQTKTPEMGDHSNIPIMVTFFALAVVIFSGVLIVLKKREQE